MSLRAPPAPDTSPSLGIPPHGESRGRDPSSPRATRVQRMLGLPAISEEEGQRAIYQPARKEVDSQSWPCSVNQSHPVLPHHSLPGDPQEARAQSSVSPYWEIQSTPCCFHTASSLGSSCSACLTWALGSIPELGGCSTPKSLNGTRLSWLSHPARVPPPKQGSCLCPRWGQETG